MGMPKLVSVTEVEGIITQGECSLCGECFVHRARLGDATRNEVQDKFHFHLKEKHPAVRLTPKEEL